MPVNLDNGDQRSPLPALFLVFQILGGQVGMPLILVIIFLSRQIVRHAIFVNFCVTWVLFSLSYVLLLYVGQNGNPDLPFGLCVTQAAMIYGSPAMTSVSSLVFVTHIFLMLREAVYQYPPPTWQKLRLVVMLAVPYLVYMAIFTLAILSGNNNPQRVHYSRFYCNIELREVTYTASGVSGLAVLASIAIEILTAVTLSRHWRAFRKIGAKSGLSLGLLIRALVFTFCGVLALLTSLAFIADFTSPVPEIVLACLPVAALLVFGTQADILRPWCFWRKSAKSPLILPPTKQV